MSTASGLSEPWTFDHLDVSVADRVLTCTFARPAVLNAVHAPMHHELTRLFARVADDRADDGVDVVVLTGAGRAFCAGGDVKTPMETTSETLAHPVDHPLRSFAAGSPMLRHLLSITQPVIAAVNGDAIGLGATLALCADVVLAAESARIGDPHVGRGLVAGDGGALVWPLLVGPNRAKEYLMTGELLPAREAERIGLVNHVVHDDELPAAAQALARRLAGQPVAAVRWTKHAVNKLLWQQMNLVLDTSLALERVTQLARVIEQTRGELVVDDEEAQRS